MFKKLVATSLILIFAPSIAFADRWRHHRYYRNPYPRYYSYPRYGNYHMNRPGVSPGGAAAIAIGSGVLGYVIGRSTNKDTSYKNDRIECKEFDIKVMIDGEEKKAKITKCRTEDGEWKIPE